VTVKIGPGAPLALEVDRPAVALHDAELTESQPGATTSGLVVKRVEDAAEHVGRDAGPVVLEGDAQRVGARGGRIFSVPPSFIA